MQGFLFDFDRSKNCLRCRISKPLSDFYADKWRRDGKAIYCKSCHFEKNRKARERNPEKRRETQKAYRQKNKEVARDYLREWNRKRAIKLGRRTMDEWKREQSERKQFNANLEKAISTSFKFFRRIHGRSKEEQRKWNRESWKTNWRTDSTFRIEATIRCHIRKGLLGKKKTSHSEQYLGCSFVEFRKWIESQFIGRMSWSNAGITWHLDHIIPVSRFDLSQESERYRCFHYANYRPLWRRRNLREQDRKGEAIQACLTL